jgi:precorrin-2 dehydrogenase/sirohydrochlorin ferrochelatase
VLLTPTFFKGRVALVIGGGAVAERKIKGLLLAGSTVIVIAPEITETLQNLVTTGKLTWEARYWQTRDLDIFTQALLVFAATNNSSVNREVALATRQLGRLVNVADDPAACDFILPGIVRRGELTLTVSTATTTESESSPALTAHLRQKLEQTIGPEYSELVELLREVRPVVKAKIPAPRRATLWRQLINSEVLTLLKANQPTEARTLIQTLIDAYHD